MHNSIMKTNTSRPQLECREGKVYLRKYLYEKFNESAHVELGDRKLKTFISTNKEDFEQLLAKTNS